MYHFIYSTLKIRKLQNQLKKWRFTIARLQTSTANYIFQPSTYNIREWYIRAPIYETVLTHKPYGHTKWYNTKSAREKLLRKHARLTNLAYEATLTQNKHCKENVAFDSDSYQIMVDNGASYSITNDLKDFVEPPVQKGVKINGYDGSKPSARTETVQWKIPDDDGQLHTITLPGTNYVPTPEIHMLSPKHWSQTSNDLRGTMCTTYGDLMVLKWNKKNYRKSFPICPRRTKNVGIMMSAPGNQQYNHLCTQIDDSTTTLAFASTIDFSSENAVAPTSIEESSQPPSTKHEEIKQHPLLINFDDELDAADYHPTFNDNIQENMHWHHRLNHATFTTMYNMARLKLLPQQISYFIKTMHKTNRKPPLCNDCTSAKACRKQWRQKPAHNNTTRKPRRRCLHGPAHIINTRSCSMSPWWTSNP